MSKLLHLFILFAFLSINFWSFQYVLAKPTSSIIIDDEYDRYKKRGDELFKEGRYFEARRQYQNCLEVPGFENDKYAKEQIEECNTGLDLKKKAEDAIRLGNKPQIVESLSQLLNLNPDDASTKTQLSDYYEREGNEFFKQKRYVEAKNSYAEGIKYANATKRETLTIQLQTIDKLLQPVYSKQIGLKVLTGVVAVGAGVLAGLLRSDYLNKIDALERISQSADPTGTGVIDNPDTYRQYDDAYTAAEAAKKKQGLFSACIGVAAVATIAEAYLLIHKPKPRKQGVSWRSSSHSLGLSLRYTF